MDENTPGGRTRLPGHTPRTQRRYATKGGRFSDAQHAGIGSGGSLHPGAAQPGPGG